MKICIISPIDESIPPKLYGGIGRVVSALTEGLVRKNHDVTLLAPGNAKTAAKLIPIIENSLETNNFENGNDYKTRDAFFEISVGRIVEVLISERFDIINNHFGWRLIPFSNIIKSPLVTTLHTPLYQNNKQIIFNHFKKVPVISISNSQKNALPHLNYLETIYNGIDLSLFDYSDNHNNYLVFLGRMSPEKGVFEAIQIAKILGIKLIMAGAVHGWDRQYFIKKIKPQIDNKKIFFVGEIDDNQKNQLLGGAKALLSPIQWEEPFGLTFVESMACGAPVITLNRGSASEIIMDGVTGIIANSIPEIYKRFIEIDKISRQECRLYIEKKFNSIDMVNNYEKTYYAYLKKYEKIK